MFDYFRSSLVIAALSFSAVAGAADGGAYKPAVDPAQLLSEQRADNATQVAAEAIWSLRGDEQGVWRETEAGHTWRAEVSFSDTQAVGFAAQSWPSLEVGEMTVTVDGRPVEPVRAANGSLWLGLEPGANVAFSLTVPERRDAPMVAIERWHLLPAEARTKQDGQSDPCHLDMACRRDTSDPHARATALILVDNISQCTGTLINNTAEDGRPLMLSAAHCLGSENARPELVRAYFRRESDSCDEDAPAAILTSGSRVDAIDTKLATHQDGWLFELGPVRNELEPYLLGWDGSGALPSEGTAIHHAGNRNKQIVTAVEWVEESFDSNTVRGQIDAFRGRYSDGASRSGASGASWVEAGNAMSFGVTSSGICQADDGTGGTTVQRFASLMENATFRSNLDPLDQGVESLNGAEGAAFEPAEVLVQVSPTTIEVGSSADVFFEARNGGNCTASGAWAGSKPNSGRESTGRIDETGNRVYRLTCENPGGQTTTEQATLRVVEASNPPDDGSAGGGGTGGDAGGGSGGGSAGWLVLVPMIAAALRRRRDA